MDLSEDAKAAHVAAFCTAPKTGVLATTPFDAWVLYTGDGYKLPDYFARELTTLVDVDPERSTPAIFLTGRDNLMLASGGTVIRASSFVDRLRRGHTPCGKKIIDDTASGTHGQAISLIRECHTHGWKRVALFVGGHHAVRALLTTVARMDMAGMSDVAVLVVPCHDLQFLGANGSLKPAPGRDSSSSWDWTKDGLAKVADYQTKEPPWCASWSRAFDYISWVVAQLKG